MSHTEVLGDVMSCIALLEDVMSRTVVLEDVMFRIVVLKVVLSRSGERTSRFATSAAVVVRGVTAVILVSVMHVVRSATSVALLVTMNGCVRRPNSRYEKAAEVVQPNPIHGNARLKRMLCERRTIPSRNSSVTATRTARSRYDKPYLIVKRARRIGGLMV
uniref:(northern house mosquito) hypothetical protein n=1 Tax=Culex pipiens TaxID=7175 RepID=A0A8D8ETT0_CULPI